MTEPVERALIIAPAWVGDAVMSEPLLRHLEVEGNHIDVLAPAWTAPLYGRMASVRHVYTAPFTHGALHWRRRWRLAADLNTKHRYQRAYVLPNSWKSALIPWLMGIPERHGYLGELRYGLINRRPELAADRVERMIDRFLQLAGRLPEHNHLIAPQLISTPQQQEATRAARLGGTMHDRWLAMCPGAEYGSAKRWPTSHFAELAKLWLDASTGGVMLLGSASDAALGNEIIGALPHSLQGRCRQLCGQTNISEAVDLIALAEHVVCNDSGLMHIAAALKRPLTALFGSSSTRFTPPLVARGWPPIHVIERQLDCRPCFKRECPFGHTACLTEIRPERVMRTLPL